MPQPATLQDLPATSADIHPGNGAVHDFDFLVGRWHVHHHRLKSRLTHSDDWEDFEGTCDVRTILGGQANIDDNVIELPGGPYRAATFRAFDPKTRCWAIWWLDGRNPNQLDPPVRGSFGRGIGTFYGSDSWNGHDILVRFIWSGIATDSARWEQAFSDDGGKTWETNWSMEFRRSPD
jgi:hypothetical protein